MPYFNEYCKLYHLDSANSSDELLFYTVRNGIKSQMSQDNVQRFMKTYEKKAREINVDGVPLPLVSEWLGHSSMETTQIYYGKQVLMESDVLKSA